MRGTQWRLLRLDVNVAVVKCFFFSDLDVNICRAVEAQKACLWPTTSLDFFLRTGFGFEVAAQQCFESDSGQQIRVSPPLT